MSFHLLGLLFFMISSLASAMDLPMASKMDHSILTPFFNSTEPQFVFGRENLGSYDFEMESPSSPELGDSNDGLEESFEEFTYVTEMPPQQKKHDSGAHGELMDTAPAAGSNPNSPPLAIESDDGYERFIGCNNQTKTEIPVGRLKPFLRSNIIRPKNNFLNIFLQHSAKPKSPYVPPLIIEKQEIKYPVDTYTKVLKDPNGIMSKEAETHYSARLALQNDGGNLYRHIPKIFDHSINHITMEKFPGITLKAWIEEKRPDPISFLLHTFVPICEVVLRLHEHKIIHADLHWKNILINEHSFRIIDFGSAGRYGEKRNGLTLRGFCAPEIKIGNYLSYKNDVYALGMILEHYKNTCGQQFGDEAQEIINDMIRDSENERASLKVALNRFKAYLGLKVETPLEDLSPIQPSPFKLEDDSIPNIKWYLSPSEQEMPMEFDWPK